MPEPTGHEPSTLWRLTRFLLFAVICLVTLIALIYAEEDWRGKHAWEKYRRQKEAAGEIFDFRALAPPPIPDAQNFALTPLLEPILDYTRPPNGGVIWRDTNAQARLGRISVSLTSGRGHLASEFKSGNLDKGTYADVNEWAAFYRGNTNYPQAPASATAAETVLVALGKFEPQLNELREAANNRPLCRFPVHYDEEPLYTVLLPHLSSIKSLMLLTSVRATAELEKGNGVGAFEDLKLGFRLEDGLSNEVFLIDQLVRIAGQTINLQTLREGLHRHAWTDGQLAYLGEYLSQMNWLNAYEKSIRAERDCGINDFDFIRRQGWRMNLVQYDSDLGPVLNVIPSGWLYQNMLALARLDEQVGLPIIDLQARRVSPQIAESGFRAVEHEKKWPGNVLALMAFSGLEKASLRFSRAQTDVDCARVACALERYRMANGKLPGSLDALTPRFLAEVPNDLFDGQPLRYRVEPGGGGYILYSIGWNQTDDGGEIALVKDNKNLRVDLMRGDWVWNMKD